MKHRSRHRTFVRLDTARLVQHVHMGSNIGGNSGRVTLSDIGLVAHDVVTFLKKEIVRTNDGDGRPVAGWHNTFAAGRIGTTGSAVPLQLLREEGSLSSQDEEAVSRRLRAAQVVDGDERGGWCLLSVSAAPTVEGTAPTLCAQARSSGPDALESVAMARAWLLNAQRPDGGWGPTLHDESRTCLTVSAILALTALDSPDRRALDNARAWLAATQTGEGAWGAAEGHPATVTHTALALRGLLSLGLPPTDGAVARGIDYLKRRWTPDATAYEHERYEATVGNAYSRIALVHDIDAEVVLTLLEADPVGLTSKVWSAAAGWVELNRNRNWFRENGASPTVWTVVPRAHAALKLSRLTANAEAQVSYGDGAVAFCEPRRSGALLALAGSSLWSRRIQRGALAWVGIIVVAILIGLAVAGKLTLTELLLGVIIPVLLLAFSFVSRK